MWQERRLVGGWWAVLVLVEELTEGSLS